MLLSLYFPVTCNPTRAVTLPNIGVPLYIGVPHRVTYPYSPMLPSVLAVANAEGVHNRTTQTLFEPDWWPLLELVGNTTNFWFRVLFSGFGVCTLEPFLGSLQGYLTHEKTRTPLGPP